MSYHFVAPQYVGYPAIEGVPLAAPATGAFPAITPGELVSAEDAVWGPGEFVFGRANGAIRQFGACVLTPVWDGTARTYTMNFTECPNTALLGRSLYVAQASGAMVSGQYGWFQTSGVTPVNGTATVAADVAVGIIAAGQVATTAISKQILNARCVTPATQTVVKTAIAGASGDTKISVSNTDGWIVGGYVSGTGVGAAAIITFVDPLGGYILVSVVSTASLVGQAITVTYNNATIFYNVIYMNRAMVQGPIT